MTTVFEEYRQIPTEEKISAAPKTQVEHNALQLFE